MTGRCRPRASVGVNLPMLDPEPAIRASERGAADHPSPPPRSVSIEGAAQLLRPPRDRMRHLRGAAQLRGQTIEPGDLAVRDGLIAGFAADPRAQLTIDASRLRGDPRLRRLPHAPAVRRLAGRRVRAEAERRAVRGDRARGRRDQSLGPGAGVDDRRAGARAGAALAAEMLADGHDDVRVQVRLRPLARWRAAALRAGARARSAGRRRRRCRPRCWPTRSPTATTRRPWMDGRRGDAARRCWRSGPSPRSTSSSSRSRSGCTDLERMGALAAAAGLTLRVPRRAALVHALGPRRAARPARARSTTSRGSHPDDIAPLAAAQCAAVLLPGAEFLGAEHRAPARDAGRAPARSSCSPPTPTRAPRRSSRCRS